MRDIELKKRGVYLGKAGETGRYRVWLDVSAWAEEYSGGTGLLLYTDPKGNTAPMRTTVEFDGEKTKIYGLVTSEETREAGTGVIEARWMAAGVVAKSDHYNTVVMDAIYTGQNVGDNTPDWVRDLMIELNAVDVLIDEANQMSDDVEEIRAIIEGAETGARAAASDSEAWAVGKRNGTDVEQGDPTYEHNSLYYALQSGGTANASRTFSRDSEAWAVGQRGGVDVGSTDETYQNNSKYYAQHAREEAEAWAVGQRNGVDVDSEDDAYHNNAKYYSEHAFSATPEGYEALVDDVELMRGSFEAERSGRVVLVPDGTGTPVRGMKVYLEAVQDLSHGAPAAGNVQPITGHANTYVYRLGKNLFKAGATEQAPNNTASAAATKRIFKPYTCCKGISGGNTYSAGAVTTFTVNGNVVTVEGTNGNGAGYAVPVAGGQTYVLSAQSVTNGEARVVFYKADGTPVVHGSTDIMGVPFMAPEDAEMAVIVLSQNGSAAAVFTGVQLEAAGTATEYEAYSETGAALSVYGYAGYVYGGFWDVDEKKLVVTHKNIASYAGETLPGKWISSMDAYTAGGTPTTGAQVVYELAQAEVYDVLTEASFMAPEGFSEFWATTGKVEMSVTINLKERVEAAENDIKASKADITNIKPRLTAVEGTAGAAHALASHSVQYTAQSLTSAQKEQARDNMSAASAAEVSDLKSAIEAATDVVNLLTLDDDTEGGVTLTNNSDGTITLSGTASSNTDFEGVTLPAGTYTLKRNVISGSMTASSIVVKYGPAGSTSNWSNNASLTFASDTHVFLRIGSGTYTNYKVSLVVTENGSELTAVDRVAREQAGTNSTNITALGVSVDRLSDAIDDVTEQYNYFRPEDGTVSGVTLTNLSDGSLKLNGTAPNTSVDFVGCVLLPGTYKMSTTNVSGTGTSPVIRYKSEGDTSGTNWSNNTEVTFASEKIVYLHTGSGAYTDYIKKVTVTKSGSGLIAVDKVARDNADANSTQITTLSTSLNRLSDAVDGVTGDYNLFAPDDGTNTGVTLTNLSDGSFKLNGTTTSNTGADFTGCVLPAGTYKMSTTNVSGTGVTTVIRYKSVGASSGTNWSNNTEATFSEDTIVYLHTGSGTFTNYIKTVTVKKSGVNKTAVDLTARNKLSGMKTDIAEDITAINGSISSLNTSVTALNEYKLPGNLLSKYNVFTCVDKTAVKMESTSTVIAYGDSITAGAENPDNKSWVNILQEKIGFTLYKKAHSGATYGHVREEEYWISTQLANTADTEFEDATLVVFAAGTNDAGYDTAYADLKSYVQSAITYVRNKKATVPILFITPIKRGGTGQSDARDKVPYMSGIIENVALQNGCSVICGWDFPIPSIDEGEIDGLMGTGHIHPGPIGQQIYARCVLNAIM